jgi:cytochrome o ubiquinol oxidase subunit 3
MSAVDAASDPYRLGHGRTESRRQHNTEHAERRPASKRIIVGYGFWIFLLSDIIMFSAFFASYAVLSGETAGGPSGHDLFNLRNVGIETALLLLSSFTCGIATIGARARHNLLYYGGMAFTFVLGASFLFLELREFTEMIGRGAGPSRSAFLSAFFTLVGCHGLHVTLGLLWLLTMMAQVFAKGYRPDIQRRILCFGLFWHALDIIWVAVFTVVYLMGAGQ